METLLNSQHILNTATQQSLLSKRGTFFQKTILALRDTWIAAFLEVWIMIDPF